jgi:hypothetical protein
MSRKNEFLGESFGDTPRGQNQAAEARRSRLSQQQKDWILENINRLQAPTVVPDAPPTDLD